MIAFCYLFSGAENMFHSIFQARSIHGAKTVTCTTSVHSKFLPHLQRLNSFCVESEALWEPYAINCSWVLEDAVECPSYDNGVAMFLGCYLRVWAFQHDYTSHSEMSPWRLSTGQCDDPKSADEGERGPHCEQHANCTLHTEYFITYQLFWIFLVFRIAIPHSVFSVQVAVNEMCTILIINFGSYTGKHLLLHCILNSRYTLRIFLSICIIFK